MKGNLLNWKQKKRVKYWVAKAGRTRWYFFGNLVMHVRNVMNTSLKVLHPLTPFSKCGWFYWLTF